ncbi:hypothetical protein ACIQZB_34335 [Streptomyces sp. NPDC097727]|uniref:hypothetical protein n=1 Tax=Streptomyces sp. NPDC097727 TaxID=3366092 RepID=UPI00381E4685
MNKPVVDKRHVRTLARLTFGSADLADDTDAIWTVRLSSEPPHAVQHAAAPEEGSVDCELSATAEQLYLLLWNRLPLTAITPTGDPEPARLWCENSGVTWS